METMITDFEVLRGMMFRTSLAPDRGMLFVHPKPEHYTYWMYQTLIPLDIIWLDSNRDIVEMVRMPSLARRKPASARSTAESRFHPSCSRSLAEWLENSVYSSAKNPTLTGCSKSPFTSRTAGVGATYTGYQQYSCGRVGRTLVCWTAKASALTRRLLPSS